MGQLKLYGMRTAYDEIITTAVKRQHEPQQIIGDLLHAEITEKQARSVKYQMTIAKLPLAKEINEFDFEATDINETLIRDLATGDFLDHQRNLVLIGGTGTGKTHLAVSIARACIRSGRRGRFFNVVDLVNKLDADGERFRVPWEQSRFSGLLDLYAQDVFQLFRCSEAHLGVFRTPRASYATLYGDADPIFVPNPHIIHRLARRTGQFRTIGGVFRISGSRCARAGIWLPGVADDRRSCPRTGRRPASATAEWPARYRR